MRMEAADWIGYMEHKTGDALEVFTANRGKGGWTIFAEMVWARSRVYMQEMPWCTTFIFAVLNTDILGRPHPGSRVLYRRMKRWGYLRGLEYTPRKNDIVFLTTRADGRVSHCGIVESCDGETVTSIDGNTVDPTGFFRPEQGGAVARRTRKRTDTIIVGYAAVGRMI